MYYHVWFGTKYRRRLLQGEIGPFVETTFRTVAVEKAIAVLECKCFVDHAHLLVSLPSNIELPKAIQLLKGISAYRTFRMFPSIKLDGHTLHLWRAGYGFREVPEAQVPIVRHYIRTQELRPEKFDW